MFITAICTLAKGSFVQRRLHEPSLTKMRVQNVFGPGSYQVYIQDSSAVWMLVVAHVGRRRRVAPQPPQASFSPVMRHTCGA